MAILTRIAYAKSKMKRADGQGFTIVELLIATAVFAVVLLVAQVSFVQIGHLFYKGVSITQTQDTADHIFQDVSGNFQTAASVNYSPPGSTYHYICIGNTRYTYNINREVDTTASQADHSPYDPVTKAGGNFGILKDVLHGGGGACATPCNDTSSASCPAGSVKLTNPVELLGNKMRVEQFDVSQIAPTSNLYRISIVLAYGDDDTLTYKDSGDFSTVTCQGDSNNNFCAVSRINTSVYKGGH